MTVEFIQTRNVTRSTTRQRIPCAKNTKVHTWGRNGAGSPTKENRDKKKGRGQQGRGRPE